LEELYANLRKVSLHLIKLLRCLSDDALDVVGGATVGDDDDVERLDRRRILLELFEVRLQDAV